MWTLKFIKEIRMSSSWDETRNKSRYHFDPKQMDPLYDTVKYCGNILPCWNTQLENIIEHSRSATWRTRGTPDKPRPESELAAEEHDLERFGYGKNYEVTNLNWELPTNLQRIANLFGMQDTMARIHVQLPGQVWNLHLDKLEKWMPQNPDQVHRYMIQLTDWHPGHFWSYGNYTHQGWSAGDVTTFDWQHVPHATANAGHTPRVTLQITGVATELTHDFLRVLRSRSPYQLTEEL
jgi:hypothetical protein